MANTAGDKLTQAKGKARETMGNATGNEKQQVKGKAEQAKGKITKGAKDLKNNIEDRLT